MQSSFEGEGGKECSARRPWATESHSFVACFELGVVVAELALVGIARVDVGRLELRGQLPLLRHLPGHERVEAELDVAGRGRVLLLAHARVVLARLEVADEPVAALHVDAIDVAADVQLAAARVDGEPVEGELDADEAVELQAPVVAQEGVEVAEEPVPLLLLHAESHERLAHAQGVELLLGDGASLLPPRGEGALAGHEVGPVLAVEPLGDSVQEAAVGEGVELADRRGTGRLLPLQHPVEEEAERAAQESLEGGGRDGALRRHAPGRPGTAPPLPRMPSAASSPSWSRSARMRESAS